MTRHSRVFRVFALTLAAYSLLASARELVPGLCATLAAIKDSTPVCDSETHSCCSGAVPDSGGLRVHAEQKPHAPCAFCNLAKGLIKTEAAATVPCDPAHPEVAPIESVTTPSTARLCAESRPRDPPSPIAA